MSIESKFNLKLLVKFKRIKYIYINIIYKNIQNI